MEVSNLKRFLSIDYGTKRIGLALSDPLKTFAYPYKTVLNNSKILAELKKIISDKNIEKIILGFPLKEDGTETVLTKEISEFKSRLEKIFPFEILFRDERYSSSIAAEQIKESVTKKSKRKQKSLIDSGAAAVILQDYLDEKRSGNWP